MRFSNLATYVSILSIVNAAVLVVTQTQLATVYVNGAGETVTVSASTSSTPVSTSTTPAAPVAEEETTTSSTAAAAAKFIDLGNDADTSSPTSTSTQSPTTLVTKTSSSAAAATTSASSDSGISGDVDKNFAKSILDTHNKMRAAHSADPLEWSDELYQYAADYASQYDCSGSLKHSGGKYGENLAVGFSTGPKAVDAWYSEGTNYDYSSANSFDHFTQIIWKGTSKLGCAYKDCSAENWGKYVICSYDPAGNMIGSGKANLSS